ncbi:universal stress protein [Olivibacter sp. SDN3]|uniref:universal stress protein n=1 Tax=Olivibacter sp. SDN3 TaxID=2764720 RepID=UPI0016512D09|nr:universal stress protein [Olivibacter sp. SDN3]QNL50154.1 universal stress protein [Olivibacter sp. SDN3]
MKTILIATDFSESATNAAKFAAFLSNKLHTKTIILYHTFEFLPLSQDAPKGIIASAEALIKQRMEHLDELKTVISDIVNSQVDIITITDSHGLNKGINLLAQQHEVEMVVIGLSGKNRIEQLIIGSNTARLTKECKLPLLIVPLKTTFVPIEQIILACDMKNVAGTVPVKYVKNITKQLDAKLTVVHVDKGSSFNPDIIWQQYTIHELLDELQPEYHFVENKNVSEGILNFAEQRKGQMIISIMKDRGFMENLFHKSVTKHLVHLASMPLLIMKLN